MLPKPTHRAMVEVGRKCNVSCVHCYHSHEDKKTFTPVEKLKNEVFKAQQKGNNYIDFSGGEPSIYPEMAELVNHCTALSMKCCIITNGLAGKNTIDKLISAGVDDWLVSVHGTGRTNNRVMQLKGARKRQERLLQQLTDAGADYRFNCCMLKLNQKDLINTAKWAATKWKPRIFNFINFNPHHDWHNDVDGTKNTIADLDVLEEQLSEAIPILLDAGIGVNVRYYPMCRIPEAFRMHICNDLHVMFDPYEWSNYCEKTRSFKNYYDTGMDMSKNIEWQGQPCQRCSLKFICGGINSSFYRACEQRGCIEAVQVEGAQRDDFYHYRRKNYACLIDRNPQEEDSKCIATLVDDSTIAYIPVFIRDAMKNVSDRTTLIFSSCTDTEEIKKITDKFIGYGIFEQSIIDINTVLMEYKQGHSDDDPTKELRVRMETDYCQEYTDIKWVEIKESKILPSKNAADMYRLCGLIDDTIEEKYIETTSASRLIPAGAKKHSTPVKKSQMKHHNGDLLIFTVCDTNYQWYAPLFIKSINMSMPDQFVKIMIIGNADKKMLEMCSKNCSNFDIQCIDEKIPGNHGYGVAAYRFLVKPPTEKKYDYTFITDIDMMMYREHFSIIDIHMNHLDKDGTSCYENFISEYVGAAPRLPGVMFVTDDWWDKTTEARSKELETLLSSGAKEYYYDEVMIGRVIINSGLTLPPAKAKLWRHHGVHIGDWRLNMARKKEVRQNVFQKMHIKTMLNNSEFVAMAGKCSEHMPTIEKVIKKWPTLFK